MELSKEIEDIISDAIHDVCEECIARHDCKRPCFEVVRMRQLAVDVVKAERERCVNDVMHISCGRCFFYSQDKNACVHKEVMDFEKECSVKMSKITKAIEGENKNERQIESRI